MKKQSKHLLVCALSALLLLSVSALGQEEGHFSVKEYNEFHDVLHPLQHEALPNKDFKTIRAQAGELTTRGEAIVKLGVPAKVKDAAAFAKELKKFGDALSRFKSDAAGAADEQLEESYLAVHDTFEMLAHMLPRK